MTPITYSGFNSPGINFGRSASRSSASRADSSGELHKRVPFVHFFEYIGWSIEHTAGTTATHLNKVICVYINQCASFKFTRRLYEHYAVYKLRQANVFCIRIRVGRMSLIEIIFFSGMTEIILHCNIAPDAAGNIKSARFVSVYFKCPVI